MPDRKYDYDTRKIMDWIDELEHEIGKGYGLSGPIADDELARFLKYQPNTIVVWRRGGSRPGAEGLRRLAELCEGLECQKSLEELAALVGSPHLVSPEHADRFHGKKDTTLCGEGIPRCPRCQRNYDDDRYAKSSYQGEEMCAACAWSANQVRLNALRLKFSLQEKERTGISAPLNF